MKLTELSCRKCGGKLKEDVTGKFKCECCQTSYYEESVRKEAQTLKKLLDEQKQEKLANLKRLLWEEVNKEYTDSREILHYCKEIKKIYPDDFYANLYETLNGGNEREVCKFLDNIDVDENYEDIPDVLRFMFKSLTSAHLLSVENLIERAYEKNRGQHEKYMTEFEKEAEKVQGGLYDPAIPRDVFIMYSSKDIKKVMELTEYLEKSGTTCFVAARNLQHGRGAVANYEKAIETAIDNCKVIVFVSSTNSRRSDCEAIKFEMPYIKKQDISRAPAEYANNYEKLPDKYKKPRVEYVIESYTGSNSIEKVTKEFFGTLQWAQSKEAVAERVNKILFEEPIVEEEPKVKYCLSCGMENIINAKYCVSCSGNKFVGTHEEYITAFNKKLKAQEAELKRKEANLKKTVTNEIKNSQKQQKKQEKAELKKQKSELKKQRAVNFFAFLEDNWVAILIILGVIALAAPPIIMIIGLTNTDNGCFSLAKIFFFIGIGTFFVGGSIAVYGWFRIDDGEDEAKDFILAIGSTVCTIAVFVVGCFYYPAGRIYVKSFYMDESNGVVYAEVDTNYTVWEIRPEQEEVTIPSTVKGRRVKEIGSNVCSGNEVIRILNIENTELDISSGAFSGCPNLESVKFADGGKYSLSGSFSNNPLLNTIDLGEGSEYTLNGEIFMGCGSLRDVKVGSSKIENENHKDYLLSESWSERVSVSGGTAIFFNFNINQMVISSNSDVEIWDRDSQTTIKTAIFGDDFVDFTGKDVYKNYWATGIFSYTYYYLPFAKEIYLPATVTNIPAYFFGDEDEKCTVYFAGTKEQWEKVVINSEGNSNTNVNVVFETSYQS